MTSVVLTIVDVDRAARITFAVIPAFVLGYCAGRLRREPEPVAERELELELVRDADLPLARDGDRDGTFADLGRERS
jgi:hypothetical protein